MPELHDLSALEQADAIRRKQVSPTELVSHYLARIDAVNPLVGAFVTVTGEQALEQAAAAEATLVGGGELPPFLGVPTAIKDLNMTAGVRTTFGSATLADFVAPVDDNVVILLREAGFISLGKTNTPEFGLPCYSEPDVAAPARTPFDLSRSAGGSSGGAGAAVASGLVPIAQGSDGGGSIRIPASVCGAVGLKTSRGRVSRGPMGGDAAGLSVNGPIARTVRDAAAMLDAMARPMIGDPYWAPPLPAGETFLKAAQRPPGRLRIGMCADPVIADAEVDPLCITAYENAASLLSDLGHEVVACSRAFSPELVPTFEMIWMTGAASIPVAPESEHLLRPLTLWLRERGRAVSAPRILEAFATAQMTARQAIVAYSSYDAVLTPTLAQPPAAVGGFRNDADPESDFEAQKRFTPFTAPLNVTGQPAISLPLFWSPQGLPIGIQLIGRPAGEASLLSLAAQLEQACPWQHHVPACW